jgi:hypothetical protein
MALPNDGGGAADVARLVEAVVSVHASPTAHTHGACSHKGLTRHIESRYALSMSDPTKLATRPYARPGLVQFLSGAILLVGWLLAGIGVGYMVNGATKTGGFVDVPVRAEPSLDHLWLTADERQVSLPDGNHLRAEGEHWELRSWGSTMAEQLLSRADGALTGLASLAGAILLSRLLQSIAEGRPFQPGNAQRIATIAALVAVVGTITSQLPRLAAYLVLNRIDMDGADSLVHATELSISLTPLLYGALLLVTAECFRRGAELAHEVDGLI